MEEQKKPSTMVPRAMLKDIIPLTKEECVGTATATLNELMRDRISLEILKREKEYDFNLKPKDQNANIQFTEATKLCHEFDDKIRIVRQVIEELKDGRITI